MNSFKKLQQEEEERFQPPEEMREQILKNLQVLQLMGQSVELYIPKVFQLFVSMLDGSLKEFDDIQPDEEDVD